MKTEDLGIASDNDDKNYFPFSTELNETLSKLKNVLDKIIKWFQSKCFLLTTSNSEVDVEI